MLSKTFENIYLIALQWHGGSVGAEKNGWPVQVWTSLTKFCQYLACSVGSRWSSEPWLAAASLSHLLASLTGAKKVSALQKLQYCYNIQQDGLGGDVSDSLGGLRLCVHVGSPCLCRAGHHDSQVPSPNQHLCEKSSPSVLGQSMPTSWRLSVPSPPTCSAGSPPWSSNPARSQATVVTVLALARPDVQR